MGSHAWVFTELRHNLASKMSWTWRGFWRDDPVFRHVFTDIYLQ